MTALALCLILAVLLWRGAFASVLWRVSAPLLSVRNPFSAIGAELSSKAALGRENEQLRAQLASTSAALADRNALYQENLVLKAQLGRTLTERSVLAGVLMRPPEVPYDSLMLDAGASQGIAPGDLVSAGGTTVIGTIDQVYRTTSRVKLFSSPGESYQGLLAASTTRPSTPVTVVGQGGGSLSAQVPTQTAVVPGDSIVLPGVGGGFIGSVSHVDEPSGSSFETLYLQLPVNMQELSFVEILLH